MSHAVLASPPLAIFPAKRKVKSQENHLFYLLLSLQGFCYTFPAKSLPEGSNFYHPKHKHFHFPKAIIV